MKHLAYILTAVLAWGTVPGARAADWQSLPASASEIKHMVASLPMPDAAPSERGRRLICVDPGHPNSYNSATNTINGTNENHINWAVALKLRSILQEKGFEVAMTKNAELQSVENKERALICNNSGAALAVHLHCETTPGSGFALYYPDREGTFNYNNDPDIGFKGPTAQVIAGSQLLAQAVQTGMRAKLAGSLNDLGIKGDSHTQVGASQGALTFSIFSQIPTLTIEMVVLTDKHDAAFIKSEAGQQKMAQAIASGIALAAQ